VVWVCVVIQDIVVGRGKPLEIEIVEADGIHVGLRRHLNNWVREKVGVSGEQLKSSRYEYQRKCGVGGNYVVSE